MVKKEFFTAGKYLTIINEYCNYREVFKLHHESTMKHRFSDFDYYEYIASVWVGDLVQIDESTKMINVMPKIGMLLFENSLRVARSNEIFQHTVELIRHKKE